MNKPKNILSIGLVGNSCFFDKGINNLKHEEPGGKGYNQAIVIKKLGGNSGFVGVVGDDIFGNKCIEYLSKQGVSDHIIIKKGKTTYANIYVDNLGNNDIVTFEGVKFEEQDIKIILSIIDQYDIIMFQNEIPFTLNEQIIPYAIKQHKMIIINPAPWNNNKIFEKYLNDIFLVTPNESEARSLFPNLNSLDIDLWGDYLSNENYRCKIIITLGDRGALLIDNKNYRYYETKKVQAIDTTGAGDALNGAVAYGLSIGMSMDESVKLGIDVSTYSVTKSYVLESYPTMKDINFKKKTFI